MGKPFYFYENKKYDQAHALLQSLLARYPDNMWFLDLMTDLDLSENKAEQAIARLQKARVAKKRSIDMAA